MGVSPMLSADAEDYLAEDVALFDALVDLGGAFERELRGDRYL